LAIALRLPLAIINRHQNTGIVRGVGSREADRLRAGSTATANDIDLRTAHVELGLRGLAGAVQSDDFGAEKIVSWCDAGRKGEVLPAAAIDHAVYAPVSGAVEAVFGDFEPLQAVGLSGCCVVDFGPGDGLVFGGRCKGGVRET